MRKVKIIRVPDWQQSLNQKMFNIINDISDVFATTKNLIITLLICYSLIFLVVGFAWSVIDYKLVGVNK